MITMSETTHIKISRDTHERLEWHKMLAKGISTFDELINDIMDKAGMGSIEIIRETKRNFPSDFGTEKDAAQVSAESS